MGDLIALPGVDAEAFLGEAAESTTLEISFEDWFEDQRFRDVLDIGTLLRRLDEAQSEGEAERVCAEIKAAVARLP